MNKKILDILEFDKVKQLFEPYLQTEQGEMELAALTPTDKKESIETAFMELEDMEQILLHLVYFGWKPWELLRGQSSPSG